METSRDFDSASISGEAPGGHEILNGEIEATKTKDSLRAKFLKITLQLFGVRSLYMCIVEVQSASE
uniref:Uncharacterized protein n=1 Tax=Candidozyma auris TaxID=498019 RepID=A0A0L0P3J9_CANAR